jgi:hypothetical protein
MSDRKVTIKNLTNTRIGFDVPDLKLSRTFDKKGATRTVDFDIIQEAIYDPGIEYMFKQGLLGIDNLQDKIDLGLEPEGVTVPQNIIVLDDKQKERYMTVLPMRDFKENLASLPKEQIDALVDYAIEHEKFTMDKTEYLKELTGINIVTAIQLKRSVAEDKKHDTASSDL